jgi:hypothetical protein
MPKHTPGPWRAETDRAQYPPVAVWSERRKNGSVLRECVAGVLGTADSERTQADAQLIAAAPDLLAACLDIRAFLRRSGYDARIVDAAIAKATGGTDG